MENENNIKKKDATKEKILLFIIGVLVGTVISTATFFVYAKTLGTNNSNSTAQQMPSGTPPEIPSGQNRQSETILESSNSSNSSQSNS